MTEIDSIVEALNCFDGAAAARIDWEPLFPDWESPVRRRYVHNTRTMATGVRCPEKRPGCYQELRENAETSEWRAVCSRASEECARRTLTLQQATEWALDVKTLCRDIAGSLKTGASPYEHAPGVWDCGQMRFETKQAGILFVVGGDGLSERLACARGVYDGAGIMVPAIEKANNRLLAVCENYGAVTLGIAEHCRIDGGRIVAKSLEVWTKALAGVRGTGMKACALKDAARVLSAGGRHVGTGADATRDQPQAEPTETTAVAPPGRVPAAAEHRRYQIRKRGVKKTRFNNKAFTMTTWRCCFEGRGFDLPDVVASALLVELFRCPDSSFGAEELLSKLGGEAAVIGDKKDLDWMGGADEGGAEDARATVRRQVAEHHERWDAKTVRDVATQIRELQRQIADCGDDPGTASEKADLEDELERLNGELRRNTKFGAGGMPVSKAFEGDRAKAGNLIGKHMRKLIAQLKAIDAGLWKHLSNRAVLKYGQTCHYSKQTGYAWHID